MIDEVVTHNNGEHSYRVEFEKEDQDTVYKSVKVFRWCRDKQEYVPLKEWKNVKNVWTGKHHVSALLELGDEENDGFRLIVHIYNDRVMQYQLTAQDVIIKYSNDVTDSDVVLAYFVTECGRLYVFDDHTLLVIKKPPSMEEILKDGFWTWYYQNYSIKSFESRILDVADTHTFS